VFDGIEVDYIKRSGRLGRIRGVVAGVAPKTAD